MLKPAMLALAMMLAAPVMTQAAEITLVPAVKLQIGDQDNNGRFDVKQHLQSPWNVLVGAQYEITRNFNVTTEIGFAERNSFFMAGEYRF